MTRDSRALGEPVRIIVVVKNLTNPLDYTWWLASRAAGVTALVLVSVSVLIGLAMAAGLLRKPAWKKTAVALHEQLAIGGLVAIAVHGVTLLGDSWLKAGPIDLVAPFFMTYRPGFTGLGVIAGWLALLLGLSFYARRWIGAKRWRSMHRATLLVWLMAAVHTLGAGTDAGAVWLQAIVAAPAVGILLILPARLLRPRRRAAAQAAARRRAAAGAQPVTPSRRPAHAPHGAAPATVHAAEAPPRRSGSPSPVLVGASQAATAEPGEWGPITWTRGRR